MWRVCSYFVRFLSSLPMCLPYVFPCLHSGCPALLWLSFVVLFLGLSLLFLFPLRTIRKKKGRKGFAPCVLSSCVVVC